MLKVFIVTIFIVVDVPVVLTFILFVLFDDRISCSFVIFVVVTVAALLVFFF